ncbi:hypothetical protein [uncultured Trichococcus sp.]|uniref:hypothetical protein n=1 Tax=uncultured Trichococcus sp. TaxID=189665 RepID=UPI002A18DF98|nr:hypothetical protein [uncultured Trichococcus sp.]
MLVDWATMSSNYANFAGILAGFVFSGIFLLLEDEKRDASEVISILIVGFFGLLLTAFLFSNISGMAAEANDLGRIRMVAFHMVIASIIFSIAIMQMFLSLVFIFILYRLPTQVISLGKTIYYGSALIATMFVIRTIPVLYSDEAILAALPRNLYLAVALTAVLMFILSKLFRRKLDAVFERYFIMIITATFLFMLLLVVLYNTQIHLKDIPVIVDQVIMVMFTVNMMINNFSINHEYRMMQLHDEKMIV